MIWHLGIDRTFPGSLFLILSTCQELKKKECSMPISQELLDILACPKCKGDIRLNEGGDGLICDACRLLYPIKDDIPVMLIDEAIRL
jgi:uncharacterized protein YbaR (Trm112 family)